MRQAVTCLALAFSIFFSFQILGANEPTDSVPFKAFTGKITRNKVRMRLQPSLDAPILRELTHKDLLIVVGEANEFYAVKPPPDVKAYVFRTFVLDNVIEGNHVNVRLEPDLEAPVIAQLNTGDRVNGTISPLNNKWLEISPPDSTNFYVCKEYVENLGGPQLLTILFKQQEEADELLEKAEIAGNLELKKPFEEINLEPVYTQLNQLIAKLNKVSNSHYDFHEQIGKAKELLTSFQEKYFQKKLAYLEEKANTPAPYRPIIKDSHAVSSVDSENIGPSMNPEQTSWILAENRLYEEWSNKHPGNSLDDFYKEQRNDALVISGIIEPYKRSVRNKPGDFILISKTSRLPVAYLYSTKVDLDSRVGEEATLLALPRPSNNFAFPAYYVLSME